MKILPLHKEDIEEIFSSADLRGVPPEYVVFAKIVSMDGDIIELEGNEYADYVKNSRSNIYKAEMVINIQKFSEDIFLSTQNIFSDIGFSEEPN
jgi:hypothetical protein